MKNFVLLAVAVGMLIYSVEYSTSQVETNDTSEFTILFSANVNGELEPCG